MTTTEASALSFAGTMGRESEERSWEGSLNALSLLDVREGEDLVYQCEFLEFGLEIVWLDDSWRID